MSEISQYVESDAPIHIQLEKKCKSAVDEMALLVDTIKQAQKSRLDQTNFVSFGQFGSDDDRTKAHAYLSEIDTWLSNLWQNVAEVSPRAHHTFVEILHWLYSQFAQLDGSVVKWKEERRLFLMGGPADTLNDNFARLRTWFQMLETLAVSLREQIDRYSFVIADELIKTEASSCIQRDQFLAKCQQMVEDCKIRVREAKTFVAKLIQKGMIVYEEPPAIVRRSGNPSVSRSQKHSRIPFNAEIRFLAGEKSGFLRSNLDMEALLISEQQAREVVEGKVNPVGEKFPTVGDIGHPACTVQAPSPATDGYMSAKFNGARVQKVEKAAEDDASRVMYHILFRIKMKRAANGTSTYYPFWAISLPFSVVINANRQERYKRALMFWQLAFAMDDKTSVSLPFDEKNEKTSRIPWVDFFNAMNLWFKNSPTEQDRTAARLQRGLEEYESFMQEKIELKQTAEYIGNTVTWDMVYRRKSDKTGLTFWDWIFATVDSISKFPHYWESGLVLGFASRAYVEQLLRSATEPSMVLKFSDSRPGKMVASYVTWNPTAPNMKLIEHVIFDEADDPVFAGKSLIECIRMSSKLQCIRKILPSNHPIEEFYNLEHAPSAGKNGGQHNRAGDGYVKPGVVFVWGEAPVPPIYSSDVRSPAMSIESSTASPGASMPAFDNPAFVAWVNSASAGGSGDDSQSSHSFYYRNHADSFSGDQFGMLTLDGSTPHSSTPSLNSQHQQLEPLQPQQQVPTTGTGMDFTDLEDPNFNIAEYLQLK